MTTSVLEGVQELLRRPETVSVGFSATADSIGTNYLLDASEFLHSRDGDKDYTGGYVWRYNLTGDDAMRKIVRVEVSSGKVFIDGTYADQSDLDYILVAPGIYPQELINCVWAAQRKLYREDRILLPNGGEDMDMERPDTLYWDGGAGNSSKSNCNVVKNGLPAHVYSRSQSLAVSLTGANGYVQSERFTRGINPNRDISAFVIVTPVAGTVTAQFFDGSGSAVFGTQLTYAGESTAIFMLRATTPAGCERVHIRIGGVGASDGFALDSCGGPFALGQTLFPLPSTIDESYKLPFIRRASFGDSVGNNVYDAYSRRFVGDYINGSDFHVESYEQLANPYNVIFEDTVKPRLDQPLFLAARKSRWDTEPLTSISSVSYAPFGQFMAYVMYEVGLLLHGKRPDDPRWMQLMADQKNMIGDEEVSRPQIAEMPAHDVVVIAI